MSNPTPRDASSRASDDDRIQVAQLLSEAAAHGRLTLEEYEERLTKAYARDQLRRTRTLDLRPAGGHGVSPRQEPPGAVDHADGHPERIRAPRPLVCPRPDDDVHPFRRRRGGSALRRLHLTEVEIHAYSILGGQTILLPPEVNVEVHGVGVMGGFDHKVEGAGTPGAPRITIRGFSLWGGVGIKRRKRNSSDNTLTHKHFGPLPIGWGPQCCL